jgi:LPXTG-motif cell wall-anchored protein
MRYLLPLFFLLAFSPLQSQNNFEERMQTEISKSKEMYKAAMNAERVAFDKESEIKSVEIAKLSTALKAKQNQSFALIGIGALLVLGNLYFFKRSRKSFEIN